MSMTKEELSEEELQSNEAALVFDGQVRPDGGIGIRDHVLILPSVICSQMVASRIADQVEGAVSAPHDHGCAQIGADNDQTERALLGVAQNPNVAATLVVGLGCEHVQSEDVAAQLVDKGELVDQLSIQGVGGTDPTVTHGTTAATKLREKGRSSMRSANVSDLTIGIVATDLADGTVDHAAPIVGRLADRVIEGGGRVVATGVEPLTTDPAAAHDLATEGASAALESLLSRHEGISSKTRSVEQSARERSIEAGTRAWGSGPLRDALSYGRPATHERGLAVVDAPSQFTEAATGLVAAGAQVIIHLTDEGVPTGHPLAPVIKVSGNASTCEALSEDIDINAKRASTDELHALVGSIADGGKTCAERHGLTDFAITRVGPSL